jgi:hypothetical protein
MTGILRLQASRLFSEEPTLYGLPWARGLPAGSTPERRLGRSRQGAGASKGGLATELSPI